MQIKLIASLSFILIVCTLTAKLINESLIKKKYLLALVGLHLSNEWKSALMVLRSYWVGSVSWSPTGLFLACVLKRGSLLMLARLGGLLSLSTSGCNVDFGPANFLPLHPLVTYR